MKYNGIELKEITEPQFFNPPKKMVVWNMREGREENVREVNVVAILPELPYHANVVCQESGRTTWATHCAEIPEEPKPRMATWKELAYWLMDAKGLVFDDETKKVDTGVYFPKECIDEYVSGRWKVMRRDDTDWHEPTLEYMGLEDK